MFTVNIPENSSWKWSVEIVENCEDKIEKLQERIEHIKNEIDRALDYYENEHVCKEILKKALTI